METKYDENEIRKEYNELTKTLINRGYTVATMESATAGQIASLFTDTEGSSAVFKGGWIAYTNEAKVMEGIPKHLIDTYGVYSEEVANAMANLCRRGFETNIGIGVTGTMGNVDPANPDCSEPGIVYFSIDINGSVVSHRIELSHQPSRLMYKLAVAKEIVGRITERL